MSDLVAQFGFKTVHLVPGGRILEAFYSVENGRQTVQLGGRYGFRLKLRGSLKLSFPSWTLTLLHTHILEQTEGSCAHIRNMLPGIWHKFCWENVIPPVLASEGVAIIFLYPTSDR